MLKGRGKVALLVTVACLGTAIAGPAQAGAYNLPEPNWPALLPANPYTPSGTL